MAENHDDEKRPHGVTGDTVQQAADVSKPTTSAGRAIDNELVPQAPPGPNTDISTIDDAGKVSR